MLRITQPASAEASPSLSRVSGSAHCCYPPTHGLSHLSIGSNANISPLNIRDMFRISANFQATHIKNHCCYPPTHGLSHLSIGSNANISPLNNINIRLLETRSLGAFRAPTSSWRTFGPLDFVLRALQAGRSGPLKVRPAIFYHFGPFLTIFDHLVHFGPLRIILDHFGPF